MTASRIGRDDPDVVGDAPLQRPGDRAEGGVLAVPHHHCGVRVLDHPFVAQADGLARRLLGGRMSIFVQFFAFFGFIFVVLQYLQLVCGYSAIVSALAMLPMAAGIMRASRLSPRLVARFGARVVCVTGLALVGIGLVVLAQLGSAS